MFYIINAKVAEVKHYGKRGFLMKMMCLIFLTADDNLKFLT